MTHESDFVSLAFDASRSTIIGSTVYGKRAMILRHAIRGNFVVARLEINLFDASTVIKTDSAHGELADAIARFNELESE